MAQDCFTLTYNSSIGLDISNEELRGVAEYLNEKNSSGNRLSTDTAERSKNGVPLGYRL